jgi:PHD/YefM family antitoxin component YafN of YafNO toxin-antitoxin module
MKVISVSDAKAKLGRVIDQVIKTRQPIVIPRGQGHVMIAPYDLPNPEEMELARVRKQLDDGREPIEENAELTDAIQHEIRKYRANRRPRK